MKQTVPVFQNGMAQPVFPFTDGKAGDIYDPKTSHIVRYCVYVESDYDMDGNGKRDRVKVFVQVPRAATEGHYKAGTIFDACPYNAGINADVYKHMKAVEEEDLPAPDFSTMNDAPAGIPTGEMTSVEAAYACDRKEWRYQDPGHPGEYCFNPDYYNYYLIRGFAVISCAGFGTYGSDGIEDIGSNYEREGFKSVVEWIHGDRIAYTDRHGMTAIKADWANGNVAMTGQSYGGTIPFAVAVTGVPGLKTIVPIAGIADWYSGTNQQGAQRYYPYEMLMSLLAYFCTTRYHDPELTEEQKERLDAHLCNLSKAQLKDGFDYGSFWEELSYCREAKNLNCSALIVHGLNDENVITKQSEMMLRAFQSAGKNAKLLLHQGGHITPTMAGRGFGILVDGENYDNIINRWLCHYLYDLDNGADQMSALTVQSNLDQNIWERADSWDTGIEAVFSCNSQGVTIIDTNWEKSGINKENFDEKMSLSSSDMNQRYISEKLEKNLTVQGTIKVSFSAALHEGDAKEQFHPVQVGEADKKTEALYGASGRQDDIKLTVLLVDLSDEAFDSISHDNEGRDNVPRKVLAKGGLSQGGDLSGLDLCEFETFHRTYKVISHNCIDLCNPASGYEPESARESITLEKGVYHDYNLYLTPARYTFAAGHRLAVVVTTEDPIICLIHKEYTVALENASFKVTLPVCEAASEQLLLTADK